MLVKLLFAVAVVVMLAGMLIDCSYQRSTPDAAYAQGIVVGFDRPHAKQVYPIFEFSDANGRVHRVVNSSQQSFARYATGDAVSVAYSRLDPQRARIDTLWFNHRWVIGGVFVALALVFGAQKQGQSRPN
jgi:Protein of unknown function (DUF3592)